MQRRGIVAETPESDLGPVVIDEVSIGPYNFRLARPLNPEALLDLEAVAKAFEEDQYMPYWATLWPVAKHLAEQVAASSLSGKRVIEIGCGLGLPGLVALAQGNHVTFTDHDATAVKFAAENARINDWTNFRATPMDYRSPLPEKFDLVLGSDLVYEARLAPLVAANFRDLLHEQGEGLLTDQNRPYSDELRRSFRDLGLHFQVESFAVQGVGGDMVAGTLYRIRHARPY